MKLQRRQLLKWFGVIPFSAYLSSCQSESDSKLPMSPDPTPAPAPEILPFEEPKYLTALEYTTAKSFKSGYLTIIQGPTSDSETLINIVTPRLKTYTYELKSPNGNTLIIEKYAQVKGPSFYNIDKIKISNLKPNISYTLNVLDISSSGHRTVIDSRQFSTLDLSNTKARFALISCMADDYRFDEVINPMWTQLQKQNPDILFLTGDLVYVDSREFVARQTATTADIWQRYIDALNRLPVYHWTHLKPILATWDDHDFGTNDGDRNFIGKNAALELFQALYLGPSLSSGWKNSGIGTASRFEGFGQRFYLMDDRFFRQPNKDQVSSEPYGHWGEEQHNWLVNDLNQSATPAWIINGNQHFNGANKNFIESLEQNHPAEFEIFVNEIKKIKAPVVFASGDVHLSEIMKVPATKLGFETYEFTSSSMHSYAGTGWENPMRVADAYTIEFNFMQFESVVQQAGLKIDVSSWGLPKKPYFTKSFFVKR